MSTDRARGNPTPRPAVNGARRKPARQAHRGVRRNTPDKMGSSVRTIRGNRIRKTPAIRQTEKQIERISHGSFRHIVKTDPAQPAYAGTDRRARTFTSN